MGPTAILYGVTVVVLAGVSLRLRQPAALAWCAYQGISWAIFNVAHIKMSSIAGVDGLALLDCIGAAIAGSVAITQHFNGEGRRWHWVMFGSFLAQVLAHATLMGINTYGTLTPAIEWTYRAVMNAGFVVQQLTILHVALNRPRRRNRWLSIA